MQVGRRVLLLTASTVGTMADFAVAILFSQTYVPGQVNLPYGASIASVVLVSIACPCLIRTATLSTACSAQLSSRLCIICVSVTVSGQVCHSGQHLLLDWMHCMLSPSTGFVTMLSPSLSPADWSLLDFLWVGVGSHWLAHPLRDP